MKNIPIAIKFLINIFFLIIYSLIGIIFGNFLYGLICSLMGRVVPGKSDLIHFKIAGVIFISVLVLTIVFRKYFYLPIKFNFKIKSNSVKKYNKLKNEKKSENSEKMKIYIDKEIK